MAKGMSRYDTELMQKAIIRWRGYDARSQLVGRDIYEFGVFIGHPVDAHKGGKIVNTDDPDVRRIIDLINGPNGNTILKMMIARSKEEPHGTG